MRQGIALTDQDRVPWLRSIHNTMSEWQASGQSAVLACSALKRAYRNQLREGLKLHIVYLRGDKQYILARLAHRTGHYATGTLVGSQFSALEEPEADESDIMIFGIEKPATEIVAEIR